MRDLHYSIYNSFDWCFIKQKQTSILFTILHCHFYNIWDWMNINLYNFWQYLIWKFKENEIIRNKTLQIW